MESIGRWLIIKTGGNQRFIFGSNKRRLNVGASHLVTQLPQWVESAVSPHSKHVEKVVVASGVAQLLVDDNEVARHIVETVTRLALKDAPGLEVWGWFEETPPDVSLAERLKIALRRHEQHRALLVPVLARNPGLPFSERCGVTSEPAAFRPGGVRFGGDSHQLAPTSLFQADAAREALRALQEDVLGEALAKAVLSADNLDRDVANSGWVAVVHADGNGFGQMFADLGARYPNDDAYRRILSSLSRDLDVVAQESLRTAVADVETSLEEPWEEWILPLIVAGDDLTAVIDGRLARRFVHAYLNAFEKHSREYPTVAEVAKAVLGTDHLTACAGVAIVKPTHPFSQAYELSEELCVSAKRIKMISAQRVSAYDIHVVHEAAGRRLAEVRATGASGHLSGKALDEGPFVTSVLQAPARADDGDDDWLRQHDASLLTEAVDALAGGLFSRSAVHDLRTALTLGPTAYAHRRDALVARVRLAPNQEPDESNRGTANAAAVEEWLDKHALNRGLTAVDLLDVEDLAG